MTSYRPSWYTSLGLISAPFISTVPRSNMSGYLNLSRSAHNAKMRYRGSKYGRPRRFSSNMWGRIQQLERQMYNNRPELHYKTLTGSAVAMTPSSITNINLTEIGQGDTQHERTGRKIRIRKVEIRVTANSVSSTYEEPTSCFLLIGKDASTPSVADFGGQRYPMVDIDIFQEVMSFSTKQNHTADAQTVRRVKYFKPPLEVSYETTVATTANQNRLYCTFLNNGTANVTLDYAIRVWFTD